MAGFREFRATSFYKFSSFAISVIKTPFQRFTSEKGEPLHRHYKYGNCCLHLQTLDVPVLCSQRAKSPAGAGTSTRRDFMNFAPVGVG